MTSEILEYLEENIAQYIHITESTSHKEMDCYI